MKKYICLVTLLVCTLVFSTVPAMASSATAQAVTGAETPAYSLNVELTVTNGTVTGIIVYGDTGETLMYGTDLTEQTPQDAFSTMLTSLAEAGYLREDGEDEPYLLITTAGGIFEQELASDLRQIARDFLRTQDGEAEVDFTAIGADVSAKAATLGLPGGRYLMMAYIADQQGITVEEAIAQYSSLKVRDLMKNFDGLREAMDMNDGENEEEAEKEEEEAEKVEEEQEEETEKVREQEEEKKDKPSNNGKSDNDSGKKDDGKK